MNSKKLPFKIGIIGAGRISQSYFEAIHNCSTLSISAVLDIRKEAAEALAEQADARPFYDLKNYVKESGVEASIVCTPPYLHKDITCQLIESGHHILCEKPLAVNLEEGLKMIATAQSNKKTLMMASKFRYVEDIIRAKGLIASGIIGTPYYYENQFSTQIDMSKRWNSDPQLSGGGVLADNGTHSVDIARYLLGPIQSVRARNLSPPNGLKVEDTIELSFSTLNHLEGTIHLSWKISLDRNAYITLYGSDGRLKINWNGSAYQRSNQTDWIAFGNGYNKIDAFKRQVINFVETIDGKTEPLISEKESLASLAAIEASYKSLKSGNWENVDKKFF